MKNLFISCLSLICLCSGVVAAQPANNDVLLEQVRVIVGDGTVLAQASVLIHEDRIVAVGDSAAMTIPAGTQRVNLNGKTLLPALIDAHAHLGYEGLSSWGAENYSVANLERNLDLYAFYGFGAVFSAGSDPAPLALELQQRQVRGEVGGAQFLFAAGMAPPGQGPNNQFLVEARAVEQTTGTTIVSGLASTEDAVNAVQRAAALGIGFIKLWVDDRGGSQVKLSPALYRAAISEANRLGLRAVVHQQAADDMPELINAGIGGFLHGRLENNFTQDIAQALQAHQVFVVPNLGLGELRREAIGEDPFLQQVLPPEAVARLSASAQRVLQPQVDQQLEQVLHNSFALLLSAGADIVLGTDAGALPDHPFGYTGHRELEIFVRHGMSPMQAIQAGTSAAARALGLDAVGQVKAGYRADLLILDADPLEDIRNTQRIHQVYLKGKLIDREAIAAQHRMLE